MNGFPVGAGPLSHGIRRGDEAPVELVAVDLDGTLLRRDSTLAPEGARALRAADAMGVHVVLATTRTPDSVRRFAREIGLVRPLICTNGAQVFASPDGPTWAHHVLLPELAWAVAELCDDRGWSLITTVGDTTYYRQRAGQTLGAMGPHRTVVSRNVDALAEMDEKGGVLRILTYEAAAIPEIWQFCAAHFSGRYHLETYYYPDETVKSLGIYAPESDKGTALTLVMERLKVRSQRVMAIGDNPNDLPMFAQARLSVAMGNAVSAVKDAATVVGPSNDQEGVAWAVERYVLDSVLDA